MKQLAVRILMVAVFLTGLLALSPGWGYWIQTTITGTWTQSHSTP